MGLLTVGAEVSLSLFPALGTLFLLLDCLIQACYEGLCFPVLLHFYVLLSSLLLWHQVISLGGLLFSEGKSRTARKCFENILYSELENLE